MLRGPFRPVRRLNFTRQMNTLTYFSLPLFFLCFTVPLTAQRSVPDSLLEVSQYDSLPDTTRARAAVERAEWYLARGESEGHPAAEAAVELANACGDKKLRARAYQRLAYASRIVGDPGGALSAYGQSIPLYREVKDSASLARCLMMSGVVNIRTGELAAGELFLHEALQMGRTLGDSVRISQTLGQYALLRTEQGQTQAALDSLVRAFAEAPDNDNVLVYLNTNMCALCYDAQLYDRALEYCRRGLRLAKRFPNTDPQIRFLNNFGEIYRAKGMVDSSLAVLNRALDLEPGPFSRLYALNGRGIALHLSGRSEEGIADLNEALALGKDLEAKVEQAVSFDHLSRIYLDLKDYEASVRAAERGMTLLNELGGDPIQETELMVNYLRAQTSMNLPIPPERLEHYFTLKDSLFNNQLLADVAEVTDKFRVSEARAENAELELDNIRKETALRASRQRLYGALLLIALAGIGLFWLNKLRRRNARLAKENATLYAELNHRTNDNLDVMVQLLQHRKEMVIKANGDAGPLRDVERQINVFSLMQQLLLKQDGEDVNLQDYLGQLTELYETGKLPGDEQLDVDFACPDRTIRSGDATVLGLIVNELITNSIKYGRREGRLLRASLYLKDVDKGLEVRYEDAGPAAKENSRKVYSTQQGINLIDGFTDQLKGRKLPVDKPFAYRVRFPL